MNNINKIEKYLELKEQVKALEMQAEGLRKELLMYANGEYANYILTKEEIERSTISLVDIKKNDKSLHERIVAEGFVKNSKYLVLKIVKKGE